MNQNDFKNIGEEIRDIVQNAIETQDFSNLSDTIQSGMDKAIDTVGTGIKDAGKAVEDSLDQYQIRKSKKGQELYRSMNARKIGTILYTVFSYICGGGLGIAIFVLALLIFALSGESFGIWLSLGILLPFCVIFFGVGIRGSMQLSMIKRFERYQSFLQDKTYGNLSEIASFSGKKLSYVRQDLQNMIEKGWFLQGHFDEGRTCLITSDATYHEYLRLKEENQRIRQEEEERKKNGISEEAHSLIREGREFVDIIHECNEAIEDEQISEKIALIEEVVDNIFDYIETYPSMIGKVERLMEYYLPTTVKLLKAYEELDRQSVQGENIQSAKAEIKSSLDVLCKAYKRKLDDLFQEQAWDVSSDISVLKTMLAQDGLTEKDF